MMRKDDSPQGSTAILFLILLGLLVKYSNVEFTDKTDEIDKTICDINNENGTKSYPGIQGFQKSETSAERISL